MNYIPILEIKTPGVGKKIEFKLIDPNKKPNENSGSINSKFHKSRNSYVVEKKIKKDSILYITKIV